jgi:hypothetical protein
MGWFPPTGFQASSYVCEKGQTIRACPEKGFTKSLIRHLTLYSTGGLNKGLFTRPI